MEDNRVFPRSDVARIVADREELLWDGAVSGLGADVGTAVGTGAEVPGRQMPGNRPPRAAPAGRIRRLRSLLTRSCCTRLAFAPTLLRSRPDTGKWTEPSDVIGGVPCLASVVGDIAETEQPEPQRCDEPANPHGSALLIPHCKDVSRAGFHGGDCCSTHLVRERRWRCRRSSM